MAFKDHGHRPHGSGHLVDHDMQPVASPFMQTLAHLPTHVVDASGKSNEAIDFIGKMIAPLLELHHTMLRRRCQNSYP